MGANGLKIVTLGLCLFMFICYGSVQIGDYVAHDGSYTILLDKDYTLSKGEPQSGAYLGAYIEQATWLDANY